MAVTQTASKATLAVRIRNGQTEAGEWKYKLVNISGVKDDFGADVDLTRAGNIYSALSPLIVGTADGLRLVQTSALEVSA